MSFTTFEFFLFIAAAVIIYYVIPKKLQWIWLLIISYVYYASYDISTVWMLLLTTYVTYRGGILLDRLNEQKPQDGISREEKKDFKKNIVRKKQNKIVPVWSKRCKNSQHSTSINRTNRPIQESSVLNFSCCNGNERHLNAPSQETINKK